MTAAARGAEWLVTRPDSARSLAAYYKLPCALLWSGYRELAWRALDAVKSRFLRSGGDLDGQGVTWLEQYRIYPHAWLAFGAAELGDTALAQALSEFLMGAFHRETGGFTARADGCEEIMTTSMAGLASLRTGHSDAAAGARRWLEAMLERQPDLAAGLYHVWHPDSGLVRGDGSAAYFIDASKPRQWYFQYGIAAAFLSDYARIAGESAALDLAVRYLDASRACGENGFATLQSGKLGWGAAWTFRQTGNEQHRTIAASVVSGLARLQADDGSWDGEGVYKQESADTDTTHDVTAEMTALLAQMGACARV